MHFENHLFTVILRNIISLFSSKRNRLLISMKVWTFLSNSFYWFLVISVAMPESSSSFNTSFNTVDIMFHEGWFASFSTTFWDFVNLESLQCCAPKKILRRSKILLLSAAFLVLIFLWFLFERGGSSLSLNNRQVRTSLTNIRFIVVIFFFNICAYNFWKLKMMTKNKFQLKWKSREYKM